MCDICFFILPYLAAFAAAGLSPPPCPGPKPAPPPAPPAPNPAPAEMEYHDKLHYKKIIISSYTV